MTSQFRIRVTMQNGKEPLWDMMMGDVVLGPMSFIDVVEFAAQAASVLRYQGHEFKAAKRAVSDQ